MNAATFATGLFLLLALAACGSSTGSSPSPSPAEPSPSAPPSPSSAAVPESPVEGLVIDIEETGPDVRGFTIRSEDGDTWTFRIGELDNGDEFPPSHLHAHQDDDYPVLVTFHVEGGDLVATHLDDGTPPS